MSKFKLRKKILKVRQSLNMNDIKIGFDKIINLIKKENIDPKNIGGYYPVNFEVSDLGILKEFEKRKFNISLPVITKNFGMNFYKWSFSNPLKINKFGIPEPDQKKLLEPDILLVPLVAFDNNLNRLGYGGGYYDRFIERINKKKKILKIGLGLTSQRIRKVPINEFDQKLDYIVTNKYITK